MAGDNADPWAGMPPLCNFNVRIHRCSVCHMAFNERKDCVRHTRLPACEGATVKTKVVIVNGQGVPGNAQHTRQTKKNPGTMNGAEHIHAEHIDIHGIDIGTLNNVDTLNIEKVEININVGSELGDLVKSGSVAESELIRRTILENADLRRQLRTLENIPAAIFRLTKGTHGPRQLRNVKREGGTVTEVSTDGPKTAATIKYCKATAVKMLDELQKAIRSVSDASPVAVQEWARDVAATLAEKTFGNYDYPTVLNLYCDASTKFYKLPPECRQTVSGGVRDIAMFIADTLV